MTLVELSFIAIAFIGVFGVIGIAAVVTGRTPKAVTKRLNWKKNLDKKALKVDKSQRSQHQNKDRAIKQLKSRLYEMELQKKEEEIKKIEDSKTDIGWGNQIRSYVLDQSRIKDIRTKHEETNTQSVLDGKINNFIKESLKHGY